MASVFTKIVRGEIPCYKVAEDARFFAFLDINPMVRGHVLVIPKQEVNYIFDLDDRTFADLHLFAKKVAKAIVKAVPCVRVGVIVAGLEVPHTHIHLIPIQSEKDLNLANPKLSLSKEEMEGIAHAIASKME